MSPYPRQLVSLLVFKKNINQTYYFSQISFGIMQKTGLQLHIQLQNTILNSEKTNIKLTFNETRKRFIGSEIQI